MEENKTQGTPLQYADALITYYGVLKVEQLADMLKTVSGTEMSAEELVAALMDYSSDVVKIDGGFAHYAMCEEHLAVYEEVQHLPHLDYPARTAEDIERDYADGIIWSEAHRRFKVQLDERFGGLDDETTQDLFAKMALMFNYYYEIPEIIKAIFLEKDEIRSGDKKAFSRAITEVYNKTPLWIFKGNTPEEADMPKMLPIIKTEKVGRNDPCPCGSGKKYKKCCMNK